MINKYIKIYIWQFISIVLNFGTLFIVTPYLSSNKALFGIYTIIVSLNLFLSYADLGFISAGLKYASESYAKGDRKEETRIIGFVAFVFSIFVGLFLLATLVLSIYPDLIVSDLTQDERSISRTLLLILSLFSPTFVLQRMLQVIFAVRLEDYYFQRLLIISNIVKILSTFYFFSGNDYPLISYFLFTQVCNAVAMLAGIRVIRRRLDYDLKLLWQSFRYSKELFQKTRKLAFSSVVLTICWILYYQLDPFVIGKLSGANTVAIYAIGMTLLTYVRSVYGILFSPFTARFNHYIGTGDTDGLRKVFINVLAITLPLTAFPVICIALTTKTLVINWVGPAYSSSILIAQLLVLCYLFSFISSPAGILIIARERVKMIYITSTMLPAIFWVGIAITYSFWGVLSFAVFKLVAFTFSAITYFIVSSRVLQISITELGRKIILPALLPSLIVIGACLLVRDYLPTGHNKVHLFTYLASIGVICLLGIIVYYFFSTTFKKYLLEILNQYKSKFSIK